MIAKIPPVGTASLRPSLTRILWSINTMIFLKHVKCMLTSYLVGGLKHFFSISHKACHPSH